MDESSFACLPGFGVSTLLVLRTVMKTLLQSMKRMQEACHPSEFTESLPQTVSTPLLLGLDGRNRAIVIAAIRIASESYRCDSNR